MQYDNKLKMSLCVCLVFPAIPVYTFGGQCLYLCVQAVVFVWDITNLGLVPQPLDGDHRALHLDGQLQYFGLQGKRSSVAQG